VSFLLQLYCSGEEKERHKTKDPHLTPHTPLQKDSIRTIQGTQEQVVVRTYVVQLNTIQISVTRKSGTSVQAEIAEIEDALSTQNSRYW
jgi:predicted component of type VI protein secretion system